MEKNIKKAIAMGGLAGILLAGTSLNADAQKASQKRKYIPGNVNGVQYEKTTEKDFSRYKLEEQCLFNNCYNFWKHNPQQGELNFAVSKVEDNVVILGPEKSVEVQYKKYTPKIISRQIDVTDLAISRESYEKLKSRAKEKEFFGFSVDATEKDLEVKIPEITVNGLQYYVLKVVEESRKSNINLPLFLIPKKGTKIIIPNKESMREGFKIDARIVCDETGGVYQPFLINPSLGDFSYQQNMNTPKNEIPIQETSPQKAENPGEIPETWGGNTQETPYMRYLREKEMQEKKQNSKQENPKKK